MALFADRKEAGRRLAQELREYQGRGNVLVLALPRGGVPVAQEVARALDAPLDIYIVRKLGVPGHEELAMGAIASGGVRVLNREVVQGLAIPKQVIDRVAEQEAAELERREQAYRGSRPYPDPRGKIVILIDDGLATGASMRAAVEGLRQQNPAKIIVAVPTASQETCEQLAGMVDEIVCATTPRPFYGVGMWYEDFSQTSDEEVRAILNQSKGGQDDREAGPRA